MALPLIGFMILAETVSSQEEQMVRMNLADCLARALLVSPDLEQAEINVKLMEARFSEAKSSTILPQLQLTQIFGPAPGIEGDPNNVETVRSDLGNLGIFSRTSVELLQPIYTFGKIRGAKDAARAGLEAGEAGVDRKKEDIVLQIRRLYHSLVLAMELREVVLEGQENVQKARKRVNELIEEDSDDVGQNDLFKIDVFDYEVEKNFARAAKSIEMGKAAMMQLLKIDRGTDFDIIVPQAEPEVRELETLQIYVNRARYTRADIKQLRAGLQVRRALLRVSRSDFFPQIALAGRIEWGTAPHRPHFSNPFLNDQFNFFRLGAVLMFRQSFNFGLTNAKHQVRKAEYEDLMSKEEQAVSAVALEVERAYRDVKEANINVQNSDRAMRSAKAWMTSEAMGFDITGDSASLLNAFTAYSRMQNEYHQAVYSMNISRAVLDHTTGAGFPN
ncbi:MAG: TolC family protein [Gemmatimonadota bacterium]|nr:TolC family protein [Gemmatimonadota bacterium]